MEAAEMLEDMIKSTHQLDEILQRMCAADAPTTERAKVCASQATCEDLSEDDTESDGEFEDCVGLAGEEEVEMTAKEYFQVRDFL